MEKKKAKKRDDADLALSQGSVFVACEASMLHMYHMSAMFCQEVNDGIMEAQAQRYNHGRMKNEQ